MSGSSGQRPPWSGSCPNPGKADPSILYRNGDYSPDYRELAANRYQAAIARAQRLGRCDARKRNARSRDFI